MISEMDKNVNQNKHYYAIIFCPAFELDLQALCLLKFGYYAIIFCPVFELELLSHSMLKFIS